MNRGSRPCEWPDRGATDNLKTQRESRPLLAEKQKQHFALAFHLGRLLLEAPDNADLKKRRDDALKRHADVAPRAPNAIRKDRPTPEGSTTHATTAPAHRLPVFL